MKWGILATGTIAKKFASTVEQMGAEGEQLVAVGSRHLESAQAFAQQYGIPRCYDSYEALAADPEIIYFDEPTSALDPELTGEVLRVLRELAEHKTTMIIVTHEMKFARDAADRILFMDGGVVVEQGDARELIDHPKEERTRQFLASYGK